MAEIILQDEFEPYLASRGFVRKNKVFRLSAGDGLAMEVWLNPENRLTRVATVSVDVALALDDPGGSLYTFDRANNAQALERGHDWRESSYSPELPGWPRRTVDDFIRYTVHFMRLASQPSGSVRIAALGAYTARWFCPEAPCSHAMGLGDRPESRSAALCGESAEEPLAPENGRG